MVSATILKLPTAPRDLPKPATRHRPRAQPSRLSNADVARRFRARQKKCAVSTRIDFDALILEMLIHNHLLSRQEAADDSPKGLRKIGEAISHYLVDRAHKEIY
jgi:hypothetical protein